MNCKENFYGIKNDDSKEIKSIDDISKADDHRWFYDTLVNFAGAGFTIYVEQARKLAKKYGFSQEPLEKALRTSGEIAYMRHVEQVSLKLKNGWENSFSEKEARELAEKYGLSLSPLEEALKTCRKQE